VSGNVMITVRGYKDRKSVSDRCPFLGPGSLCNVMHCPGSSDPRWCVSEDYPLIVKLERKS